MRRFEAVALLMATIVLGVGLLCALEIHRRAKFQLYFPRYRRRSTGILRALHPRRSLPGLSSLSPSSATLGGFPTSTPRISTTCFLRKAMSRRKTACFKWNSGSARGKELCLRFWGRLFCSETSAPDSCATAETWPGICQLRSGRETNSGSFHRGHKRLHQIDLSARRAGT